MARPLSYAQVVSCSGSLSGAHTLKREKYAGNPEVSEALERLTGVPHYAISVTSLEIFWRGLWAAESVGDLLELGLLAYKLAGITTRVLQGSHTNWTRFNQMTGRTPVTLKTRRQGSTQTGVG